MLDGNSVLYTWVSRMTFTCLFLLSFDLVKLAIGKIKPERPSLSLSLPRIYVYIYVYRYVHIYIYMYVYLPLSMDGQFLLSKEPTRTNHEHPRGHRSCFRPTSFPVDSFCLQPSSAGLLSLGPQIQTLSGRRNKNKLFHCTCNSCTQPQARALTLPPTQCHNAQARTKAFQLPTALSFPHRARCLNGYLATCPENATTLKSEGS